MQPVSHQDPAPDEIRYFLLHSLEVRSWGGGGGGGRGGGGVPWGAISTSSNLLIG